MAETMAPGSFVARASFPLLACWFAVLWIAGGASRPDVIGQPFVRAVGAGILVATILLGNREAWQTVRTPALLLAAIVGAVLVQMIPLPPALWSVLPGRDLLAETSAVVGQPMPWRPISMSPSRTANALGSLIVPAATLALMAHRKPDIDRRVIALLAIAMLSSALLAAFQISGGRFDHPFLNDVQGEIGGSFANRNHMAVFLALGCVVLPTLVGAHSSRGLIPLLAAVAAVAFFLLLLLASGSRTGLALGLVGTVLGFAINRKALAGRLSSLSRTYRMGLYGGIAAVLIGTVALALFAQRAVTIDRALGSLGNGDDLRTRAFPTLISMIEKYFPAGSGFGTFDPVFRIDEPLELLRVQYFNLAHNDLLQIWLDGGLLGGVIFLAGLAWLALASWRAWRTAPSTAARLGSAIMLLTILASATDYPARTPMFMALIAVACVWLAQAPQTNQEQVAQRSAKTGSARSRSDSPGLPGNAPSL